MGFSVNPHLKSETWAPAIWRFVECGPPAFATRHWAWTASQMRLRVPGSVSRSFLDQELRWEELRSFRQRYGIVLSDLSQTSSLWLTGRHRLSKSAKCPYLPASPDCVSRLETLFETVDRPMCAADRWSVQKSPASPDPGWALAGSAAEVRRRPATGAGTGPEFSAHGARHGATGSSPPPRGSVQVP